MSFELNILGTGSAAPTSNTNPSAQLLKMAERFFLIDCGEGTQQQLRRIKASFNRINHIFISHLHGDHFFGLPGLLSSFNLFNRETELHLYGPPQLEAILDAVFQGSETTLKYKLVFHSTQNKEKELLLDNGKVEVYSIPLKHRVPTTGFLFKEKPKLRNILKYKIDLYNIPVCDIYNIKAGKDWVDDNGKIYANKELTTDPKAPLSYAYCSDTAYTEKIIDQIEGVNLLYHETTFLEEDIKRAKATRHSTAKQAATIASKASVKNLLIGHFSVRYKDKESFLSEALEEFKPVLLSKDLHSYVVENNSVKEIDLR